MSSYHTPARDTEEARRPWHWIDWPVLAAFSGLLLVSALAWGLYETIDQNDSLVREAEHSAQENRVLAEQVDRLQLRLQALQIRAAKDREEANEERSLMLRQQATMIQILRGADLFTLKADADSDALVLIPGKASQVAPIDCEVVLLDLAC